MEVQLPTATEQDIQPGTTTTWFSSAKVRAGVQEPVTVVGTPKSSVLAHGGSTSGRCSSKLAGCTCPATTRAHRPHQPVRLHPKDMTVRKPLDYSCSRLRAVELLLKSPSGQPWINNALEGVRLPESLCPLLRGRIRLLLMRGAQTTICSLIPLTAGFCKRLIVSLPKFGSVLLKTRPHRSRQGGPGQGDWTGWFNSHSTVHMGPYFPCENFFGCAKGPWTNACK